MAISETKMQMVIANYFKDECDVNTSIRQAFEKGFRIGVKKGASTNRPQGEWIPCSERLPDERQDVYVTVFWDDYGDTITAYGMRTQFGWSLWNTAEAELIKGYTVIAWMPLPEPWKGADDEV